MSQFSNINQKISACSISSCKNNNQQEDPSKNQEQFKQMQKDIQSGGSGSFTEQRNYGEVYQESNHQNDYGQTFGDLPQQGQASFSSQSGGRANFSSQIQGGSVEGGAVMSGGMRMQAQGGSSSMAVASSSAQQSSQQTTTQTVTKTVVTTQRVSSAEGRLQMNAGGMGFGEDELEMMAKGGYSGEGYMSASAMYRYGGYNLKADHAKLTGGLALGRYNFSDASLKDVQFKSQSGKVQIACDAAMAAAATREAEYGGARMAGWELELQAMAEMRAQYKLSAKVTIRQKAFLLYGSGFRRREKPDDEELEKQKCDDEDMSKRKQKPEDLNEEECCPDELFKKKPKKPEDLNEEECNPDDLFKKKPKKPEDLNEEECNPDELFKKKPKPNEDEGPNEEECCPDELFKKKPKKPEDLNEEECNPDELFKKKPKKPEDLNEEECNPDELFKKKPKKPEDLNEEECNPDELNKRKKKPEDLNEEECNPDELNKRKKKPLYRSMSPVIFAPMSERVLPIIQTSIVYPVQSVRTILVPTLVTCEPTPITVQKVRNFSQSRIYSVRQPLVIQEEAPTILQGVQFGTPRAFRPKESYVAVSPAPQQFVQVQPQVVQTQLVPIQEVVQTIQVAAPTNLLQAQPGTYIQQNSQVYTTQGLPVPKKLSSSGIQYVSTQPQQYVTAVAQPSSQQFIQMVAQPQQIHFEEGSPTLVHSKPQLATAAYQTFQAVQTVQTVQAVQAVQTVQPVLQQSQPMVLAQGQLQEFEVQRQIQAQPLIAQAQSIITQTQPTMFVQQERMQSPIRQVQQLVQQQQYNVVPQVQAVTLQQQVVHQPTVQAVVSTSTRQIQQAQQIVQPLQQVQQIALAGSAMRHSAFVQINPTPLVPVSFTQSIPLITTSPMYQSVIKIQSPPPPQIVRQRPIHVVDLEQYDDLWRKKVEELEKQLKELQNKKPEPVQKMEEQVLELRAGADTEDLEKQISQLQMDLYHTKEEYEELMQKYNDSLRDADLLREQIKNHVCTDNSEELQKIIYEKEQEIEHLKALLAQSPNDDSEQLKLYQQRIAELEQQLKDAILNLERYRQENASLQSQLQFYKDSNEEKDAKIKELEKEIDDLNGELDDMQGEQEEIIEQKVETIRNELKTWKDKFLALNVQYHDQQEKLMLTEAELEHIKKQGGASTKGSQVITTTTTKQTK